MELAADLGMTWNVALPELSEKLKEAKMKREAGICRFFSCFFVLHCGSVVLLVCLEFPCCAMILAL